MVFDPESFVILTGLQPLDEEEGHLDPLLECLANIYHRNICRMWSMYGRLHPCTIDGAVYEFPTEFINRTPWSKGPMPNNSYSCFVSKDGKRYALSCSENHFVEVEKQRKKLYIDQSDYTEVALKSCTCIEELKECIMRLITKYEIDEVSAVKELMGSDPLRITDIILANYEQTQTKGV